jgi:hypothetical protein
MASFSSSGNKAGTIPDVNMLLINSKNPENEKPNANFVIHLCQATKLQLMIKQI